MKLKLKDLTVQSFVTVIEKENQETVRGGEVPTIPVNVCNTVDEIRCNLSIERCTRIVPTVCCI